MRKRHDSSQFSYQCFSKKTAVMRNSDGYWRGFCEKRKSEMM